MGAPTLGETGYIALMGRSGWAVVNAFHSLVIETDECPETVKLLYEAQYADETEPILEGLEIIQETYTEADVEGIETADWDAKQAGQRAQELGEEMKDNGQRVILDITSGRKALVVGTILALRKLNINHVHYLAIETTEGVAKPYPLIPRQIQQPVNLVTNEKPIEETDLKPDTDPKELIVKREELMILLNNLYKRQEKAIISCPLLKADLLELDPMDGELTRLTDNPKYHHKLQNYVLENGEHPHYGELKQCLSSSGVLPYKNIDEFKEILKKSTRSYDSVIGRHRAILALDTNMFYRGFPTLLKNLEKELGMQASSCYCITPYPVLREIEKGIADKYDNDDIERAKSAYEPEVADLLNEFRYQHTFHTRFSKMANASLNKYEERPTHERTQERSIPNDSEKVDQAIVDELQHFAQDKGGTVVFVTSDRDMYDRCRNKSDVECIILEMRKDIPKKLKASPHRIEDMLLDLALLFGVIKIGKVGYLFGEYRGKTAPTYTDEGKLVVSNLHRASILEERIQCCRKLLELEIPK